MTPADCCILNSGGGSWAFEPLARQLSDALWIDVSQSPRAHNYLLLADESVASQCNSFVPFAAMQIASDKRLLAKAFADHAVPTPQTFLLDSLEDAERLLLNSPDRKWCVKFPTGCGASGHRMLTANMMLPDGWPMPLVVQEFIRLERPEVYRLYGAGGQLFGFVARRFPSGVKPSPWVAHVRGAQYEAAGEPPTQAVSAARMALEASGLLDSFGCVDLLITPEGRWVVLEVGTDGMFNHVDRDLALPAIERLIQKQIAEAFWSRVGEWRPWGTTPWRPRIADEAKSPK